MSKRNFIVDILTVSSVAMDFPKTCHHVWYSYIPAPIWHRFVLDSSTMWLPEAGIPKWWL